jgi:uncharacterized protein (TIGR03435 family)
MQGPMLQTLLEDRFKLKVHRETREVPVYALTLEPGASALKPFAEGSCVPPRTKIPFPELAPGQQYCKFWVGAKPPWWMRKGQISQSWRTCSTWS